MRRPADLAAQPAGAVGGVRCPAGGLASRRPRAGPCERHEARPARPASGAAARPRPEGRSAARLPRRPAHKVRQLAQLAEELDRAGLALRSATEPFDTGAAAGRMMLQMLAVFAEFEHATIVDRITAGIERRAKQGRWTNGRVPFGYRRTDEKLIVADEREAPVVRRIFALYTRDRLGTSRRSTEVSAPSTATTRHSRAATSSPSSSRAGSRRSRRSSRRSASRSMNLPPSSPVQPRRSTQRRSPPSPTGSATPSPPANPNRRRRSCATRQGAARQR